MSYLHLISYAYHRCFRHQIYTVNDQIEYQIYVYLHIYGTHINARTIEETKAKSTAEKTATIKKAYQSKNNLGSTLYYANAWRHGFANTNGLRLKMV